MNIKFHRVISNFTDNLVTSSSLIRGEHVSYLRVVLRGRLIFTWRRRGCLNPRRSSRWWHRGWTFEFLSELSKALSLFAPGAGRGLFATPSSAPAPPEPVQSVHRYHCWFLNTTSRIFIATLFPSRSYHSTDAATHLAPFFKDHDYSLTLLF